MTDDFMERYRQHLRDPAMRLKRHLKLARQLGLHPLDLVDTEDPEGMRAAVEEYLRAQDAPRLRPATRTATGGTDDSQ
jgi:hypothetical protein